MNENARAAVDAEPCAHGTLRHARTCPACFQEASITLGYGDVYGALLSWESFDCRHCGMKWESDDRGFLQPESRARMLAAYGTWTVRMGPAQSAFNAVKVLRNALGLELMEAYALLKHESGFVLTGTSQECAWLKGLLEKAGERPVMNQLTLA